jgi:hypothetical protein
MTHDVTCPFCGHHPYEYVDIGVGMQPVAVTCCSLGNEFFGRGESDFITIERTTFDSIARAFSAMRDLGMSPKIDGC